MNTEISIIDDDRGEPEFDERLLRRLDLNLLVVFAMVFRCRSVQLAADRLHLGASGVSMALTRLRAFTGDPLFVRGRHGLEPTALAQALHQRIGPALATVSAALKQQSFDPQTATGTVRVALSEDLEIVLGARLRQALAAEAPQLKLVLRHADYQRVAHLLDAEIADTVLTPKPATLGPRYCSQDLLDESFVVLGDAQAFPSNRPLSLKTYTAAPHALVSASGAIWGRIDEALSERGLARDVQVSTESFAALPFLLRGSGLLATLPRTAGLALAQGFGLALHRLPIESPRFPIAMTWRRRDQQDEALAWLRAVIRTELAAAAGITAAARRSDNR